jgi:RND family efflux transporter MFP subunit
MKTVFLLLALGMTACGGSAQTPASAPVQAAPPALDVVAVVERAVSVTLPMPAELEPYQTVAIYPKVTAFVRTIGVDRGSRVRTGDVIARLEAPEVLAQRAEAESKVQSAEAQLAVARSKADSDASTNDKLNAAAATPGVVAGNDLVLAQKAVESSQSQVVAAQRNVDAARQAVQSIAEIEKYLNVTAPFDGIVTERDVHPGALVGPASGQGAAIPIARLVQNDRLRLVVPVPEAYVAGMSRGAAIAFTVPAYPGQAFSGTIARIAQIVDVKTRTMAVEADVINKDGRLAAGTFCQVQWPVRRPGPSLLVPGGSVASTTQRTFVVRVRNGRTEWVDVKTGLGSGPLVEVFGELRPGDQVATRGTDELPSGTQVRIVEAKGAPGS